MTISKIRRMRKIRAGVLVHGARVPAAAFTALYLGVLLAADVLTSLLNGEGVLPLFVSVLSLLLAPVLSAGFILYCMTIRRREKAPFGTLLDGFAFAGKAILLHILVYSYVSVLLALFVIPGILAFYRCRFAFYHLCENPQMSVGQALLMSRMETRTGKWELFLLDLSYLPWFFLSELPTLFFHSRALLSVAATVDAATPVALLAAMPAFTLQQLLLSGVWSLAVSTLFLPQMHCVLLEYYETAKNRLLRENDPNAE